MKEYEYIKGAFEGLHASEDTLEEVLKMTKHNANKKATAGIRRVAALAAAVCLLTTAAFAADYIVNGREIFFFDTIEALAATQNTNAADSTFNYAVPNSAEANSQIETVSQSISRSIEYGYYGDEHAVSDETDTSLYTIWERKRITECRDEDFGYITNEYLTGTAYSEKVIIEGLLNWDISDAVKEMTPDEGGQLILSSRDKFTEKLVAANALLGYTTSEGKRFQIEYKHDLRYVQEKVYVLTTEYDDCFVFVTDDGIEVLIQEYDGQVWASAANAATGNTVNIYTTGLTTTETQDILNLMNISTAMNAVSRER